MEDDQSLVCSHMETQLASLILQVFALQGVSEELHSDLQAFEQFYNKINSGRRLQWLFALSSGTFSSFFSNQKQWRYSRGEVKLLG